MKKKIYLIAKYYQKPKHGVNTCTKGWMNNPTNIRWDEQVVVASRLKNKDLEAQLILNLSDKTVYRNTLGEGESFKEIFTYYFKNYDKYITQVMATIDKDFMTELVNELELKIKATEPNQIVVPYAHTDFETFVANETDVVVDDVEQIAELGNN